MITGMLFLLSGGPLTSQVNIYEKPLELPTYGVEAPEKMPDWRMYRYPYTMYDRLTNTKGSHTYNAVYVENEYVKALVLPQIGGRLHGATDKTNGYEFLYDQKVIKPGLVGITGAWISGGVEWNFPIGHRPSGFRETDWVLTEETDGSKTAWVGEIDRLTGMRWSVGTAVHPGRNWVETKIRLYNSTPYKQSFQYWATSAVRATENYQAVIPGEVMTGHGKREFYNWPVHDGVDLSYWKNISGAGSYFTVDSESDYFGGYSPEENAGIVHFADHHIVRGKKLWTWGTAPSGRIWENILTDGDLPYFEPQAGAFSDNQPSFFWIMPGETKIFSHFWFPVRDIGVFDYANLEGALKLNLESGKVIFGWSPTGKNNNASIVITLGGKDIFNRKVNADPAKPFTGEAKVSENAFLHQLKMSVIASNGDTLLTFSHPKPSGLLLPEPEPRPRPPQEVRSQDELFTIADRLNKYNNKEQAIEYYNEILKRDEGDIRTNNALGELALKEGKFKEALHYFDRSLKRNEDYFKAWYNKGLAELWLGDITAAEKSFNRSTYDLAWYAPAYFNLAQIALSKSQTALALEYINRSINGNGDNTEAWAVKGLVLSHLGQHIEAVDLIEKQLEIDPLNHFLHAAKLISLNESGASNHEKLAAAGKLKQIMRADSDNYLELAIRFARIGLYNDAVEVLDTFINEQNSGGSPLIHYYRAYYKNLLGKQQETVSELVKATSTDATYTFPNRLETFPVLEWSLGVNPEDATAHNLIAMLYYSRARKQEAVRHWEKSVKLNPAQGVAFRNLGLAYQEQGDLQGAKNAYVSALKADPTAGKVIVELGLLNKKLNIPYNDQVALFEENLSVVAGYNQAVSQLVELYVITGQYENALEWLQKTHFNSWEGRYGIHQLWVQSNIKLGDKEMNKRNYKKALEYYKQSLEYPMNLEVAEQPNTNHSRKYYNIARSLEAIGEKAEARGYYEKTAGYEVADGDAYKFFKAKALEALGKKKEAEKNYKELLTAMENEIIPEQDPEGDPMVENQRQANSKAVKLFTSSLALEGLNRKSEADQLRERAMELYPLVELSTYRPPRSGY